MKMADKKKGKKDKKTEKVVDQHQLRRDLRKQMKMTDSAEPAQEKIVVAAPEESKFPEDIRIGGIEG